MQRGNFVITNADVGFTINSINYTFEHVDSVAIDDPELMHLVRGANSVSDSGLMYTEGNSSPKTLTFTLKGLGKEYMALLSGLWDSQRTEGDAFSRFDMWVIDRKDGSNKIAKKCILQKKPQQLNIGEGADNLNIEVIVETYSLADQIK